MVTLIEERKEAAEPREDGGRGSPVGHWNRSGPRGGAVSAGAMMEVGWPGG